jgi:hypothetical protein
MIPMKIPNSFTALMRDTAEPKKAADVVAGMSKSRRGW